MSNSTESKLQNVASNACAQKLPHGFLTQTEGSLIQEYLQDGKAVPQARINLELQSFAAMTRLILPGDAVDFAIREACDTKPLPTILRDDAPIFQVQLWAEQGDAVNVFDAVGTLDRPASFTKFTAKEVSKTLRVSRECPSLPLTFLYLQSLLEQYFTELRKRIGETDPERAASLSQFQAHWANASNFMRFFLMSIVRQLPDDHPENAIDAVDQQIVTRSFEWLDACKAFEANMPDLPAFGVTARKFVCPAKPLLHELMIDNGTFMHVLRKVRALRSGNFPYGTDRGIYDFSVRAIVAIATLSEDVIRREGREGFIKLYGQLRMK